MKDLSMRLFRKVLILVTAFSVVFSSLAMPAQADQISDLQNDYAKITAVVASQNAQYSELIRLIEDNVATLDNLNKRIIENQNQTNGAIISISLDEELQVKKKALEKIILDRSDQSKSIAANIKANTSVAAKLLGQIDIVKNGGTISPENDPVSSPTPTPTPTPTPSTKQNLTKMQQSINYAYAGDEKFILAMTTVPLDMIKANASSGLPVTRNVQKESEVVCTISGNTLSFNTEGTCKIAISQAGDSKYDFAELQISLNVLKNPKYSETSACSSQAVLIENSFARTYEALRGFDSVFGSSESAANVFVGKGIKTVDEANAYFNGNYSYVQSVFTAAAMELKSGKLEPPCLQTGAGKDIYTRVMSGYNALADLVNSQLTSGKSNSLAAIKILKLVGTSVGNQADCDNLANDFISSATGQLQYMDYITSQWSSFDLLLEYAAQNRVVTWNQMIDIFKGKIEYANQNLGASQNNYYGGKLQAVCNGTPSEDQIIAKVDGYFGKGAILNQALTRMDQAISNGFSKFSSLSLNSNAATCSSKFKDYSNSLSAAFSEFSAFVAKVKAVGIPTVKLSPEVLDSYLNYSLSLDAKLRDVSTTILQDLKKYPDCQDLVKLFKSSEEYLNASSSLQSSIKSSAGSNQNNNLPESSDDPTFDGEEEAPYAAMKAKRASSGITTIWVNSNIEEDDLIIKASKKGSKTIVYKVRTKDDGNYSFKTTRNLKGFKLTLYYLGDIFSTFQL